jgi:hypothetical protein
MIQPMYYPDRVPFASGGGLCDACGALLNLEDLRGCYIGTVFQVKGYQCHECRHLSCDTTIKSGNLPFDWRRMPVARIPFKNIAGDMG